MNEIPPLGVSLTTIKIDNTTRDKLRKRGTMEDTYDTVILRLLADSEELARLKESLGNKE